MAQYHDAEWGIPEYDSRKLWETLMLEGFQAGLSWEIILRKRDAFCEVFAGFDPKIVGSFGSEDVNRLMEDARIVRSRAKIEATIKGAQIFTDMQSRGEDFADLCWAYTDRQPIGGGGQATETELSRLISKDLKHRGFKFVGPTIVYAWMQAVGIVDGHAPRCFRSVGRC
jgi:DNA-3-methyladenine glycosylase I